MIELAKAISTFGHPGQVQPSEQLITLTLGQLRELIQGAVQEATEPILQELNALRTRQDALESMISSGKGPEQPARDCGLKIDPGSSR